ncbi:MAG: hypothetical protein AAGJ79_09210 [Verrucomicrobiota bacterium]
MKSWLFTLLATSLLFPCCGEGKEEGPRHWPPEWRSNLDRFEAYLDARQSWPESGLDISEEARISRNPELPLWNLGWYFNREGRHRLSRVAERETSYETNQYLLPGRYFSALSFTAGTKGLSMGYQHLLPFHYFELKETGEKDRAGRPKLVARKLDISATNSDYWPNTRGWLFRDFILFGPGDNHASKFNNGGSSKTSFRLYIIRNAIVWREPVRMGEGEEFLEWQVFKNGKRLLQVSAENERSFEAYDGGGAYAIWLGATTEKVFFPLSNMIEVYVHEIGGRYTLSPIDSDEDGIPDYIERHWDLDPNDPNDATTSRVHHLNSNVYPLSQAGPIPADGDEAFRPWLKEME